MICAKLSISWHTLIWRRHISCKGIAISFKRNVTSGIETIHRTTWRIYTSFTRFWLPQNVVFSLYEHIPQKDLILCLLYAILSFILILLLVAVSEVYIVTTPPPSPVLRCSLSFIFHVSERLSAFARHYGPLFLTFFIRSQ